MSLARFFGIDPAATGSVRRLATLLALTTGAEILAEGVLLSAFLARVGAASLPTALALRAVIEVVVSLGFERLLAKTSPSKAMRIVVVTGCLLLSTSALSVSSSAGAFAAYVVVSSAARIKAIHFGVLALAELEATSAATALPLVQAGGRLGGVVAGPLLAVSGPLVGSAWAVAGAAVLQLLSVLCIQTPAGTSASVSPGEAPSPSTERGSGLLVAIVLGAVALALGRLALVTQSGAILERAYGETDLNRVLGVYFAIANTLAFLLQALVVGRVLGAGGLPWLNTGWSVLYLAAQACLSFAPPLVLVALSARLVEGELRNALRTPVATLLYEAMPAARRAFARTLVIGVTVPAASLIGGLGLGYANAHPSVLTAVGLAAALGLVASSWAQNRGWAQARP